ncbi:CBS domain-containing protein CBSX5 [Sesamum angolense]|uniref:CBS domain-containing protein CBSX5 n=1 Tax=Sesamum angolense TaxID=2727404 RepID=A0AAE1WT03_9LAMI|nr:CBS domain-containing protein CBSX5 [Sesamum angolense]
MAVRFLNGEVSELCLGKPELTRVAANATISDALTALKTSRDSHVSVWACGGGGPNGSCICVGKFCVADFILFLCREENLTHPFKAFEAPVSDVLPKGLPIVRHLDPCSSLLEAIDYILDGAQNLLIPIQNHHIQRKNFLHRHSSSACTHYNGQEYCWLTQEDVVRFILNSVGAFSPIPTCTIESLNIINHDIMTVPYDKPVSSALGYFHRALIEQSSVAVVDEQNRLIGEISPSTLACCDETAAAAIMALTAMDLMTYIDSGGPPEDLVQLVKMKLEEKKLEGMAELMDDFCESSMSSSCSSDDEYGFSKNGWPSSRSGGSNRSYPGRRSEAIVCSRGSSLVAVMIQALAHRVSCVWVMEEDRTVVGNVTFAGMLRVFRSCAAS